MSELIRIERDDWALALVPRSARPDEADALSALAFRSKGYWGYDAEFLQACRGELTLTADFIETNEVRLLDNREQAIGFYSLVPWKSDVELGHFFVDPEYVRRGVGVALWNDAIARAVLLGYRRLIIESDPNAEEFYSRLGAERIGEVPSRVRASRFLPLMVYPLR